MANPPCRDAISPVTPVTTVDDSVKDRQCCGCSSHAVVAISPGGVARFGWALDADGRITWPRVSFLLARSTPDKAWCSKCWAKAFNVGSEQRDEAAP